MKYKLNYEIKNSDLSEVVYGDSVTPDTPLLLRKNGKIYIETISSIFDEDKKVNYPGFKFFDKTIKNEKEYSTTDFQAWSDIGWVNIKKVIRHKCNKKIYKVLTHTGCVKVTEDHSLLTEDKNQIKPKECNVGSKLLSNYPDYFNKTCDTISKDKAFVYGFFYGDGSAGFYKCKSGNKHSFALNNSDINILEKLEKIIQREYPGSNPVIYDTLVSSGVYKLNVSNAKSIVSEYRYKFYDIDKYKKVPNEILNSDDEIVQSFFDGYWAADGRRRDKELIGCTRFDNKGQIGSAGLYYLMKRLGYNVSLNTRKDKEKMLRITVTKKKQRRVGNQIKKIEILGETDDYVYDIETDCGRFQAGVGDIIVKNTDSCFLIQKTPALKKFKLLLDDFSEIVKLDDKEQHQLDECKSKAIEEAFEQGKILSGQITERLFKKPIELEFEKVYYPFILLSKKRYIGNYYGSSPYKIDFVEKKGVVLKRRDNPEIVKKVYNGVIDPILEHGSRGVNISIEFLKSKLIDLMNNKIDLNDLVVTKTLAKGYGTYNKAGELVIKDSDYKSFNLPHVALAAKLRERDPGSAPVVNDRISYVFIELPEKPDAKLYEKVEDLQTAIDKNMKIDVLYYVENQLKNPISEVLKLIVTDVDSFFNEATKDYKDKRAVAVKEYKIKAKIPKGQLSILKFLKPVDK